MANNRQTTWGSSNLVIEQDYSIKFNEIESGEPELYIEIQPQGSQQNNVVKIVNWYHATRTESAIWRWIGMDYTTAMSCANQTRLLLTFQKSTWEWGIYMDNGVVKQGWYSAAVTPTLESSVAIVKNSIGDMYDVVVHARATGDIYGLLPNLNIHGSTRPLANALQQVTGWNTSVTPTNGNYFTSASADNIVLVTSPTYNREFEIVGVNYNGLVPDEQSPTGYSWPIWYKVRTTYQCQVKYTGMTRQACTNLFNALNGTSGWWHLYHPYEYKAQAKQGGGVEFVWAEDTRTNLYQCLNEYKAHPMDGGNLWEAELSLTLWDDSYTDQPNAPFTPTWPAEWGRVPGLSTFL